MTIPANTTGIFEDTTNSDSLAVNDGYEYQVTAGNGVTGELIGLEEITSTFDNSTGPTTLPGLNNFGSSDQTYGTGHAVSSGLNGRQPVETAPESQVQYKVEVPLSWQFLTIDITGNSITVTSTFNSRINGANGTQTNSIGKNATGKFQDTTHTDSLVAGNLVNVQLVTGSMGTNIGTDYQFSQLRDSTSQRFLNILESDGGTTPSSTYFFQGGFFQKDGTESHTQHKIRGGTYTANEGMINVITNTASTTNFRTRKNGANGNIDVSVTASTTGIFEDTTHSDTYSPGDLVNWAVSATTTSMTVAIIGITWQIVSVVWITPILQMEARQADPVQVASELLPVQSQ